MKEKRKESNGSWKNISKKGTEFGRDTKNAYLGFMVIAILLAMLLLFELFK